MIEPNLSKTSGVRRYLSTSPRQRKVLLGSKTLSCHGMNLCFKIYDDKLMRLFEQAFPPLFWETASQTPDSSLPTTEIHWFSSENKDIEWSDSGDHQCSFSSYAGQRLTIQRDFACHHHSQDSFTLFTPTIIDDGFFNFLRYFVPMALLSRQKFVFHSSCVLDDQNQATLFLGHSGFGKSTISSMFPKERVLGDDMNIVHSKNGELFVEPTHLGQMIVNWPLQGQEFKIKNIFWLNKGPTSPNVEISPMSIAEQRLKILGSLSGLYWDQVSKSESKVVFDFLLEVMNLKTIEHFVFSLQSEVMDYV